MRQTVFTGFIVLGAALGLLSAMNETFGVQIGVIVSFQQIDTVAAGQAIDGPGQGLGR
jgi:hypothetical protein